MEMENIEEDISMELENEKITKDEFAYYLTSMRGYLGMSKKDFAASLKIPQTSYYTYEQGKSLPSNWQKVKSRVRQLVKNKSKLIKEKEALNSMLNTVLEERILELHRNGKNTVQIGLNLSIDETIVYKYLKSKDLTPKLYKLYD